MLEFPRWKIILVIIICLAALYTAAPNLIKNKQNTPPAWLPQQTMNLGLDLKGGAYLLLEVDFKTYFKEQLEKLRDDIRSTFRKNEENRKRIGYSGGLQTNHDSITFTLRDPLQTNETKKALKTLTDNTLIIEQQEGGKFTVSFTEQHIQFLRKTVLEQSIEIVRRRIDETGTREPSIQQQGTNRILIQVPGMKNPDHIKRLLGKTAKLTFHLLDPNTPYATNLQSIVPSDSKKIQGDEDKQGNATTYIIKKRALLTGDALVHAAATIQELEPVVSFRFDNLGAKTFGRITKENVGKPFAIVLDNKVISAPVIREPILGGSGIISGSFTTQEANDLALLLRAGALPAPLNIIEERTVGPSLGADSIATGKMASIIGIIIVMVFMTLNYGRFGIYSNIALLLNITLIVAALSLFGATLTLPGIAGIVLTMGMAVDANVLIFERIREETKLGHTPFSAIDTGFKQAFKTIVDSNITTLIAALLLFNFGSGPIKGFAVTLSIGILASMFSAILLTRMMIVLWLKKNKPKALTV